MKNVTDILRECLDTDEVRYYECADNRDASGTLSFLIPFDTPECRIFCSVFADDVERIICVEAYTGLKVSGKRCAELNGYISGLNLNLPIGRFDVEPTNNLVQFTIASSPCSSEFSVGDCRRMLSAAISQVSAHFAAMVKLVHPSSLASFISARTMMATRPTINESVERLLSTTSDSNDELLDDDDEDESDDDDTPDE